MQKLISAKWIILLTVLITAVTTFTLVTIFPSGMWVAHANNLINCVVNKPVFQAFKSGGSYGGKMRAESGGGSGNKVIANMTITFTGTAPTGNANSSDRGKFTAVDFSSTAVKNPFNFQDMAGNGLDGNVKNAYLSDFTVDLNDGGKIHFIGGAFTGQGQQIVGFFDVTGGPNDQANGTWVVS